MQNNILYIFLIIILLISVVLLIVFQVKGYSQYTNYSGGKKHKKYGGTGTVEELLNAYFAAVNNKDIDKFIQTIHSGQFIENDPYIEFSNKESINAHIIGIWERYLYSYDIHDHTTPDMMDKEYNIIITSPEQIKSLIIPFIYFLKKELEKELLDKQIESTNILFIKYIVRKLYEYILNAHDISLDKLSVDNDYTSNEDSNEDSIDTAKSVPIPEINMPLSKSRKIEDHIKYSNTIDEDALDTIYNKKQQEAKTKANLLTLEQERKIQFELEQAEQKRIFELTQKEATRIERERIDALSPEEWLLEELSNQRELEQQRNYNTSSATASSATASTTTASTTTASTALTSTIIPINELMNNYVSVTDIRSLINSLNNVDPSDPYALGDYIEDFLIPQIFDNNKGTFADLIEPYKDILGKTNFKLFTNAHDKYNKGKKEKETKQIRDKLHAIITDQIDFLVKILDIIDKSGIPNNNRIETQNEIKTRTSKLTQIDTMYIVDGNKLIQENIEILKEIKERHRGYESGKHTLNSLSKSKTINPKSANTETQKNEDFQKLNILANVEIEQYKQLNHAKDEEIKKLKIQKDKEIKKLRIQKDEEIKKLAANVNNSSSDDNYLLAPAISNYDQLKNFSRVVIVANENMIPKNTNELYLIPQHTNLIPDINKQNNGRLQFSQISNMSNLPSGKYYNSRFTRPILL